MYAQVSSVTLQPGKADEWIAITRDSILPAAKERQGFVNALILVDREKNTGIGISLWESAEDVDAVASSGFYQEQVAKVAECIVSSERQVLEVAVEA
ncbi:MAG: hypothetical protein IIB23_02805 [Chloroflexi bacterium]|nr:hypothetical protein [Chloroflexota bacterium]MCH8065411.1 hypothetical protein [Chloroflexota bacterium]